MKPDVYFSRISRHSHTHCLNALLDKYADVGIENIEDINILRVQPISEFGTPMEIIESFGGRDEYLKAVKELEAHLFPAA